MKKLTNILSYLWLLLLLPVAACNDLEEEVGPMHVEEEVELTIQTEVSGMKGSTRTAPTESIIAITAYAFDSNSQLIKVVKAILSDQAATSGDLKIKVPKRTGDIHFIAKNNAESPDVTISIGDNVSTLLSQTTDELHYWGKATYNGGNNLSVTLIRNMAKVTLEAGNDDYIAGFLNYNSQGTLVPSEFTLGTINAVSSLDSHDDDNELGTEHYLFEHANEKNNNPLYAICNIGGKYYKIAFAYTNNGSVTYFDIIRNNAYKIVISDIDELYGEDSFKNAENENTHPINDLVITEGVALNITANLDELPTTQGGKCSVTVAIPDGITELMVDADAVFTVTSADVTLTDGKCDVNGKETVTFTLTVNANATTGDKKVSFSGRGKYMTATGSTTIRLYENATLSISPTSVYNTAGSTTTVSVPIPQGITSLTATSEAFTVTSNEVSLNNGSFDVSGKQGQSINFTLTLKDGGVGEVGKTRTVTFSGSGDYKRATGTATVTLAEAPAQGSLPVYELWFENNNTWNGSTDYATFFTKNGDITTGNDNAGNMEGTFYDPSFTVNEVTYSGADNHRSYAMTMGDGKSIGFTITEPRYLTLLVASNNGNTPSINLSGSLSEGSWATESSSAAVVPTNYNFGNGEIGTNGRLICYTLPAGTYTLQRESNDYLLYYMRVSTTKPTMTDIVQPTVSDYALSWSGGEWGNWTYVENGNLYVVDDDAKTFTLTYTGLGLTEGTLSLSNSSLTIPRYNEEQDTYTINGNSAEITNANVGTYSYTIGSGEISNPTYKYSNFYDKIALKAVNGNGSATVKHSVKLKLTNGDIYQDASKVVDYYDLSLTDPRLAICTPETRINTGRAFTFTITENWTYREDTNKTLNNGSSMMSQAGNTFTIAQGQETSGEQTWEHPFWYTYIYYLDWGRFTDTSNANRSLSTMTISTEDTDIWFSYKNQGISKSMVINVNQNPGEVVSEELNLPLNISLDFYRKYSNGTTDDNYDNLIYGVSRVGLKATITIPNEQNAAYYYDKIVYLQGAFSIINGTGNVGIHWDNSRDSGNDFEIAYKSGADHNGTQLQFQIENGKTEYDIEWVFKGGSLYDSSNNSGNVRFTYTISAQNGSHQISGQNSATLDIKRSANIHNQEFKFSTGNKWDTNKTFNEIFPIGTGIFIRYSEGQLIQDGQNVGSCTVKFTESNGANQLYIPSFENDPGYDGSKRNFYMSFTGAKDFQFTVDSNIAIYEYVANDSDSEKLVRNLSEENPLNGLQLQGTDAVLQRVTVTAPPSAFPNNNPDYVPDI